MESFHLLLTRYREKKGFTKKDLGDKTGFSASYISQFESGEKHPPQVTCEKIADALGLSDDDRQEFYLAALNGRQKNKEVAYKEALGLTLSLNQPTIKISNVSPSDVQLRRIPVISNVHASNWNDINDVHAPGVADEWIHFDAKKAGKRSFALVVDGDCMEPRFHEHQRIIVDPSQALENGSYGVFKINGDEKATFKQYKMVGTTVVLHPLNPKYEDIIIDHKKDYAVIGKVVGIYEAL